MPSELRAAWMLTRRREDGFNPKLQANGSSPSAALSIVSTPRAKAGAGGTGRRRCASLASVLLVAAALALALGLGVLVGHLAWPRPMASVAPVLTYHWRPDVVTSVVRSRASHHPFQKGLVASRAHGMAPAHGKRSASAGLGFGGITQHPPWCAADTHAFRSHHKCNSEPQQTRRVGICMPCVQGSAACQGLSVEAADAIWP